MGDKKSMKKCNKWMGQGKSKKCDKKGEKKCKKISDKGKCSKGSSEKKCASTCGYCTGVCEDTESYSFCSKKEAKSKCDSFAVSAPPRAASARRLVVLRGLSRAPLRAACDSGRTTPLPLPPLVSPPEAEASALRATQDT